MTPEITRTQMPPGAHREEMVLDGTPSWARSRRWMTS
jgi:hypothetical protein